MHFFNDRTFCGLQAALLLFAGLVLPACPMDGEDDETGAGQAGSTDAPDAATGDTTSDATTGAAATYSLSGTVERSVELARGNDGVGLLLVAAFSACGLGQQPLAVAAVANADLSAADAAVPFTLTGLPAGPVHVALFLDDNGDADPMTPLPHDGDLVYGFDACDGELDCVPLEISDADLEGVALQLNLLEVDECP